MTKINAVLNNKLNVKEFRIFALKNNMQDFKMNYKENDRKRNAREKKKLKLSWHLLLIQ